MTSDSEIQDIGTALDEAVSKYGDQPAIREIDSFLTYAAIGSIVKEKVFAYGEAGVGVSSAVGVVADSPAKFLTDVFALLELKAFVVLLAGDTTQWELERLSRTVRLDALLSTAVIDESSNPVGHERLLTRFNAERSFVAPSTSLGFLTSGTTGRSKVALRSEKALLIEATAMRHELALTPGRRVATIVPVHHSFGFGDCALAGILAGVEVCSFPKMAPSAYLAAFERLCVDVVALVPAQLRLLAEASPDPAFGRLSVLSAGAPLDARTARLASERLGCAVGQVYGTTETGVISVAQPGEPHLSVGTPCRHMELRLDALPTHWQSQATAEGIVAVRCATLFEGYVTLDGIDRKAIQSGWFSTGDCGRFVSGCLELLGRLSSAINVAGLKVSPEEVEAALLEFPAVKMALVTGVHDPLAHQRIKAYVSPADIDLELLRRFCESRLSASKRPHYYEAVAALATTPSGKVLRKEPLVQSDVQSF